MAGGFLKIRKTAARMLKCVVVTVSACDRLLYTRIIILYSGICTSSLIYIIILNFKCNKLSVNFSIKKIGKRCDFVIAEAELNFNVQGMLYSKLVYEIIYLIKFDYIRLLSYQLNICKS